MSTRTISTSSDNTNAYDQWQQWAQKQRKTRRQESANLIHGDASCDRQVHQFMELPHKRRVSLLEDSTSTSTCSSDDCDQRQVAPWGKLFSKCKSLLDDDDDDDDEDCNDNDNNNKTVVEPATPMAPVCSADSIFLPPTSLRRNDHCTSHHLLAMASMRNTDTTNLVSPSSLRKDFSFDSSSLQVSPPPLSFISALSASRQRFSFSRDSCLPLL
jgi:hypothetical protein